MTLKNLNRIVVAIIVSLLVLGGCKEPKKAIQATVTNFTESPILEIHVTVYDKDYYLPRLLPDSSLVFQFMPIDEEHYTVEWKDPSGKIHKHQVGYITAGLNIDDHITIFKDSVGFSPSKTKSNWKH
jgi:hypothetical protein